MVRSFCAWLKHIFLACLLLLFLVVAVEVGLRVRDSYAHQNQTGENLEEILIGKSWNTHHILQPMRRSLYQIPGETKKITIKTNSVGIRGPEIVVPKPDGVLRIICLGDATVLGPDVEYEETFPYLLQRYLQQRTEFKVEVINAGVPGYCPLLGYLQTVHHLIAMEPDLLIYNFDMSDVADDHQYRRITVMNDEGVPLVCPHPYLQKKPKTLSPKYGQEFLLIQWGKKNLGKLADQSHYLEDERDISSPLGKYAWLKDDSPDWDIYIKQSLSPLGELKTLAGKISAQLIISVIPAPWQVSSQASNNKALQKSLGVEVEQIYRNEKPFERLADFSLEKKILFHDPSSEFINRKEVDDYYWEHIPRFSVKGHKAYAQELARFVIRNFTCFRLETTKETEKK